MSKKAPETVNGDCGWPRLLGGQESQEATRLRRALFEATWAEQQAKLDDLGHPFDEKLVDEVLDLRDGEPARPDRLKTCLFVSPPSTQHKFHEALQTRSLENEILLGLQPTQCQNLQTALKVIIKASMIEQHGDEKAYTDFLARHKALIPMNFDLELLQQYVQRHSISRVMISMLDIETFDTSILSELIWTFHSWSDRIPFMLLVGVSTTTGLFESRFSRATISLLDAHVIETKDSRGAQDHFFNIYEKLQHGSENQIFLSHSIVNVLAELAEDQGTIPEILTHAIKYMYMSHFFANPLSELLENDCSLLSGNETLYKAVRNLSSLKSLCEYLVMGPKSARQRARQLLVSDEALKTEIQEAVQSGQKLIRSSLQAIRTLRHIYHNVLNLDKYTVWESEVQLLSSLPDLASSEIFKAIIEVVTFQRAPPLSEILNGSDDALSDLKKYYDEALDGLKHCSAATGREAQDTLLILSTYLSQRTSVSPSPMSSDQDPQLSPFHHFLAESYTITSEFPLSHIIHPRPRSCLERALTRPADYLGCECCTTNGSSMEEGESRKTNLPPTTLLLNMLNEAGVLVNVRDLWDAFRESMSRGRNLEAERNDDGEAEGDEDGDTDERQILTLFYCALAELRYLGMIKQSKRKPGVECVQKTAWMGL